MTTKLLNLLHIFKMLLSKIWTFCSDHFLLFLFNSMCVISSATEKFMEPQWFFLCHYSTIYTKYWGKALLDKLILCHFLKIYFSDSDEFRARHPITTYKHYQDQIKRIAAGEEELIIAEKPLILAMTSGTSGSSAMLLSTKGTNTEFFLQVKSLLDDDLSECIVHANVTNKACCVLLSGRDRVLRCHAAGIPWDQQPSADHQVFLHSYFSTVWGRHSHWAKLLNASLLTPHAKPVYNSSTCLWGINTSDKWSALVWLLHLCTFTKMSCFFRFPMRRTPCTCIFFLLSKILVWEHWSPTLPPQFSMPSDP